MWPPVTMCTTHAMSIWQNVHPVAMVIWQKHACLTPKTRNKLVFCLFCFVFSDNFIIILSHLVFLREGVCERECVCIFHKMYVCVRERECVHVCERERECVWGGGGRGGVCLH